MIEVYYEISPEILSRETTVILFLKESDAAQPLTFYSVSPVFSFSSDYMHQCRVPRDRVDSLVLYGTTSIKILY